MKKIYNKISAILNNMLERVAYHFIGYKVDISTNEYLIKVLRDTQSHNIDDIKAIQLTIKSIREDYESLKTYHNNLAIEYRDKTASKIDLNNFKKELNNRVNAFEIAYELNKVDKEVYSDKFDLEALKDELTKPSKNVDDNILMLENIINTITEAKINNACQVVSYGEDIGKDKVPYLNKYSMREILEHYIKNDDNATFLDGSKYTSSYYVLTQIAKILVAYKGDLIIDDFIDDVNDVFNGFNNIFNDACGDDNNINLTK